MRVIFMGTPEFSVPALQAIAAEHTVVAVYSQPPRAAGRGQKARPSAVHRQAEELGLTVRTPLKLRDEAAIREFRELDADVAVVVAYGLILPQDILDAPRYGCLNIHASLLPRWRGAAPIHRAILAGDAETGVAIMQMAAGLDTGPVITQSRTEIGAEETTVDLHDRLSQMGAQLILSTLESLPATGTPQSEGGVLYAEKIEKSEARIDWARSATEVDRQIRALSPFPGAWCDIAGERVKLLRSRLRDGVGEPGQVLDGFRVACGTGAVEITQAQRAGKKPMNAQDLLRGWILPSRLS
ncbi:methionyl-tRNA formyltransferase [Paracoccus sp. Z330]|uniref:Methionyl-tRNA formyltransferase n=1 Tax=Paracoccus onchidii TaxID=3017813 RepID=A0ABT4ZBP0_9RHOB|nr:methionyl-tRNA formyltransferase [Paracoccus onchidii]MDB6176786.1 methionyl-tRNA formyltransferase [Paracoccus onchidii]